MPRYDYQCEDCLNEFEVEVVTTSKFESRRVIKPKCPICRSKKTRKLIRPTRVIYKTKGFYITDNKK